MAARIPDTLYRFVKSMSKFILCLHYGNKGKSKPQTLTDVCNLPESMQSFIMNFFNKYKEDYDQRRCQCITPSPNCIKTLLDDFDISFREPEGNIHDPENFMIWCCKLCLQAAQLFEHGFIEAPDLAVELILDVSERSNKYRSFLFLICKS